MSLVRVLHVDDESDIREVVEIALGLDPDIVTRSCACGQDALAVAAMWLPDIILLDVMMPAMDGPATLKRLSENPETADIPVIFMTARAQKSEIETFKSLGAVGVIPKPFDPMKLAASLRTYLAPPETRLDAMRNEFLLRVDKDITTLAGHWSDIVGETAGVAGFEKMRGVAHGLAGAGGIFGFQAISTAASRLEEAVKNGGVSPALDDIRSAFDHLKVCADACGGRNRISP